MESTSRYFTYWKDKNIKARSYGELASNDEETIIKWLYQQGVKFNRCWGMECHDIGDTDFFQGSKVTDDIDAILAFTKKIYGEWELSATYEGIKVEIRKSYPNIKHDLSFKYPADCEEVIINVFDEFEEIFCYPSIKEWEEYR